MKKPKPEDIEQIIRELMRMNYHIESRNIALMGITVGQCNLMLLIKEKGRMTMSALASAVGVTTGAGTGFISRLLKRKLVKRFHDTADRRRVLVELTSKGEEILCEIMKIKRERLKKMLGLITAREQRLFSEVLVKFHGYLKRETEGPTQV